MQISSLVGKTVLSRSGEWLGYVDALRLTRDMKKLSCLVCADGEEEEFYIPARAVISAEDAVIAGRQRAASPTGVSCPVGRPVYTHTGEFCGVIADMVPGDAPELVIMGVGEARRVPVACAALGETAIVYPSAEEKRRAGGRTSGAKTGSGRPAGKRAETPKSVRAEESAVRPSDPEKTKQQPVPEPGREYRLDRTNLLGRRVKRSVYDEHGEPVALAGERITPEVIARARRSNRLLTLTVNTLTNLY